MAKKNFKNTDPKAEELEGKIQVTGQESASNIDHNINAPSGSTCEIKEVDEPKASINTRKAAEVVTAGSDSSGIGVLRRGAIVFSGSAEGVKGDISATTNETKPYKSGDRLGRRVDPITRKIDLIDAEILENKLYQSKPLCETSEGQGYTGNYHNEHAITQRNSGGSPADPLFERSVDEIDMDMLYYTHGQYNIAKDSKDLSIHSWNAAKNNNQGGYDDPTKFEVGNFLARELTFSVDENGQILSWDVDSEDLTLPNIDEQTYRLSGDAWLRHKNQCELDRNVIISKAGNESDPSWTCMGDAIIDSSAQNEMLGYVDSLAGNYASLSLRKLEEALSYQVNKSAKDGSRITGPMAEMVNGNIELIGYGAEEDVSEENGRSRCFSEEAYVNGGAGLWLALNDSLPKYTTKGKLLSLPLSFKSAAATARSNIDPLITSELLHKELAHNELFSTIDGPYDPLKPIVVTDKVGLITPIPIDVGCSFDAGTGLDTKLYTMHYENYRNKYNIKIKNFFMEGLYRWISERGLRIYKACEHQADHGVVQITIPIVSSVTSLSLWDLIVCSAVPYMVEARLTSFTEVLKYEKNFGYPYTGLVHVKDVDIHGADNYSFTDIESPLQTAIAKPVSAMKVIMPEVFWPVQKVNGENSQTGHNGVAVYTVLPHYFVEDQFSYDKDTDGSDHDNRKLVLSNKSATMAYPTVRSGNMLSYFDTIYGMSEEDYRLSLDRMVVYPGYEPSYTYKSNNTTVRESKISALRSSHKYMLAKTYKYGLTTDGIPVIPYFAYADNAENKLETLLVKDVLGTPRELGLFQVAPAGILTPVKDGNDGLNRIGMNSAFLALSGPGFRVKIYHGVGNEMESNILTAGSVNIDANASLRNQWIRIESTPVDACTNYGFVLHSFNTYDSLTPYTSGSYSTAVGVYDPDTGIYTTGETIDTAITNYSNHRYLWTRLQRLPFVVNPFDCNVTAVNTSTGTAANINTMDIFDFLYMFGFAGFRASDYSELIYQRTKEKIAKGMNYVNDPFVDKTFLLK